GSRASQLQLWDALTGKPISPPLQHDGGFSAVAFSPDAKTILMASQDSKGDRHKTQLWDVAAGKPIGEPIQYLLEDRAAGVTLSPDGRILLTRNRDHTVRLWEAATGKPLGIALPHRHSLEVHFSRDCKLVLTRSDEKTYQLWDVATGKPMSPPLQSGGWA